MNQGYRKYRPFQPIALADRTWPGRTLTQAPVWCSVDLRDGNQALVTPMNLEQKVAFFPHAHRHWLSGDRGGLPRLLGDGV